MVTCVFYIVINFIAAAINLDFISFVHYKILACVWGAIVLFLTSSPENRRHFGKVVGNASAKEYLQGNGPIRHVETCPDFFYYKSTHNKIHYQNFSC
jgi:hypothetical protein